MVYKKLHAFGKEDKKLAGWFANLRDKVFSPLFPLLKMAAVRPGHISLLGFLSMVVAALVAVRSPYASVGFLLLHLILDGIDGPYARYLGVNDAAGALTDVVVDHAALFIFVGMLLWIGIAPALLLYAYSILYAVMVVLVVAGNLIGVQTFFQVRTKILLYALYIIWILLGWELFSLFFLISVILMAIDIPCRFLLVKKHLRGERM
ncbi:MAG: CDP-alcohol phosphatidyltransferase family protein [Nanoarchaeota archaeon]